MADLIPYSKNGYKKDLEVVLKDLEYPCQRGGNPGMGNDKKDGRTYPAGATEPI